MSCCLQLIRRIWQRTEIHSIGGFEQYASSPVVSYLCPPYTGSVACLLRTNVAFHHVLNFIGINTKLCSLISVNIVFSGAVSVVSHIVKIRIPLKQHSKLRHWRKSLYRIIFLFYPDSSVTRYIVCDKHRRCGSCRKIKFKGQTHTVFVLLDHRIFRSVCPVTVFISCALLDDRSNG